MYGSREKVVTSAVCLIPPESEWTQIQEIRRQYDPAYFRWMPHINLLYPFLPETEFPKAFKIIKDKLKSLPPFQVTFQRFDSFNFGRNSTLFLVPETKPLYVLTKLQSLLESCYPFLNDLSTKSSSGFHAHLTVGKFTSTQLTHKQKQFTQKFQPITFTVDQVHFIARTGVKPFEIKYSVPLQGDPSLISGHSLEGANAAMSILGNANVVSKVRDQREVLDELMKGKKGEERKAKDPQEVLCRRIETWIKKQKERQKLPKSKEKLKSAIERQCYVKHTPMEVEEGIKKLVEEGYIDIGNVEKVEYLKKGIVVQQSGGVGYYSSMYGDVDEKEEVMEKLRHWVCNPGNRPRSLKALKNCLKQMCTYNKAVDPDTIISKLVDSGKIISTFDTFKYNI